MLICQKTKRREKQCYKIVEAAKMKVNLEEKNEKATKLMQDYEVQLPKNNSSIEER